MPLVGKDEDWGLTTGMIDREIALAGGVWWRGVDNTVGVGIEESRTRTNGDRGFQDLMYPGLASNSLCS